MVVRSWKNCVFWLVVSLAPLAVLQWRGADTTRELFIGMALVALFGLQGLVAELIGLRIRQEGLTFPRRVSPHVPFLVFWRRRVAAREISRVDTSEYGGLRLSLVTAEVVDIPTPAGARSRDLVRLARQYY
jgi:hypothetical protein